MGPVIEIHRLTKYYGRSRGIENLDLSISKGEIFGFLGPNGAGKSTTIRLMLNLLRPSSGRVDIFGKTVRNNHAEIFRRIGNVPGELKLYEELTGTGFLRYMNRLARKPPKRRKALIRAFGLKEVDLKKKIKQYSHGMKQKLGIIQALQDDPDLVIMDEPTEGLDPMNKDILYEYLETFRAAGKTVFFSSHYLAEVEKICDRVGLVKDGRLITQEAVASLKGKMVRRMEIEFFESVSPRDFQFADTRILEQDSHRLVLQVKGDINPLLGQLSRHKVKNLVFPEPSLEDSFMVFYKKE